MEHHLGMEICTLVILRAFANKVIATSIGWLDVTIGNTLRGLFYFYLKHTHQ